MLAHTRWLLLVCASLAIPLLASGCFGRGPQLGTVTGTVTLDGKPLENAQVEFQPTRGAPSYGTTNRLGQYELMYTKEKPGARVGSHVVRILTETTAVDEKTGEEYQIPQLVPEKYNYRSELFVQVKPGPNTFDFQLESEPEEEKKEQPPEKGPEVEEPGREPPKPGEPKPEAREPGTGAHEPDSSDAEEPDAETADTRDSGRQATGPKWAEVSGIVTLNGEPLVGATVQFRPEEGPASHGTTDARGRYELTCAPDHKGAVVGKHVVRITGPSEPVDAETERIDKAKLVPSRHNVDSQLDVEVGPGKNTFNFDIGT